jgi:hypothetical protein
MVGTILLDQNDIYVDNCGRLPKRPPFDKELLSAVCKGQTVSYTGFDMLPPSITNDMSRPGEDYSVPITIRELAEADVLIVVRAPQPCNGGKKFRFDKFKQIGYGNIEIFIKI